MTFVRLIVLVVLGRPLPERPGRRGDPGLACRIGMAVLAAGCLALAAVTPLEIRVIGAGLAPVLPPGAVTAALKSPWVLQPVFAGFSILSPSWLWVVMPALLAVVAVAAWLASGSRLLRVRRVPAWRSATAGVSGPDSYTAFAFANPARRVLAAVLHTRAGVTRLDASSGDSQPDAAAAHVEYGSDVLEVTEEYVYQPFRRPFALAVRSAQRLQSGRLDAYLAYMLIALIAVLAVVAGLH